MSNNQSRPDLQEIISKYVERNAALYAEGRKLYDPGRIAEAVLTSSAGFFKEEQRQYQFKGKEFVQDDLLKALKTDVGSYGSQPEFFDDFFTAIDKKAKENFLSFIGFSINLSPEKIEELTTPYTFNELCSYVIRAVENVTKEEVTTEEKPHLRYHIAREHGCKTLAEFVEKIRDRSLNTDRGWAFYQVALDDFKVREQRQQAPLAPKTIEQ